MTEERLLCISDTHYMSKVGMMLETEGFKQNPVHLALQSKWDDMVDRINEIGKVDCIFHGGDWIDGPDVKGKGISPVSCDLQLQSDGAIDLIKTIPVNKQNLITVDGSFYHIGKNMSAEQYIVNSFHREGWKASISPDVLFKIGGVTFHGKHSMTVGKSMWMYKATHIAKELLLTVLNSKAYCQGFSSDIDVVLRGHTHTFVYVGHKHKLGVSLPAWKGRDEFIRARGTDNPDLGYCIFYCDDGKFEMEKEVFSLTGDNVIKRVKV